VSRESLLVQARSRTDTGLYVPEGSQMNPLLDPLAKQRPMSAPSWLFEPAELTKLDEWDWLYRRVSDIMSEDPLRNWFEVQFTDEQGNPVEDPKRSHDLQQYLEELDAKDVMQTGLRHEVVYGDGLVAAGIKGSADFKKPITSPATQIKEIQYLVTKCRDGEFSRIVPDDDPKSDSYGLASQFKVKAGSGSADKILDATRAIHFQTRPRVGQLFGLPMAVTLWSVLQLEQNVQWSVGQIAYRLATTYIRSKQLSGDMEEREEFQRDWEGRLNSMSFFVLDEDEAMGMVSNNPGSLVWLINFMWDLIAAATRINRTRLLGAQAGKLASAESDMKRYYEWVRSRQETQLRKPLRKLVTLCLATDTLGTQAGGKNLMLSLKQRFARRRNETGMHFRLVFNPPESQTERERAEGEEKEAQTRLHNAQTLKEFAMGLQLLADLGLADPLAALGKGKSSADLMAELFQGEEA